MNRQAGSVASLLFSLVVLLTAAGVFIYRQEIKDWAVLQSYKPTAEIAELATNASLSDHGRQVFYATAPELHGKSDFSKKCQDVGDENSNVLGCYSVQRIYIFDVQDPQLQGVREVTAAHEMLHAAYERLSDGERQRVNKIVQQQLDAGVDEHIKGLIELYNRIEPGQLLNEMHSIIATEQSNILPELESYYTQYFKDRKTVVKQSDAYRAVFDQLKASQTSLADEISKLADEINTTTAALNNAVNAFNDDVQAFNSRAGSGTMTQEHFDSERAALAARKETLNQQRIANDALRDQYAAKQAQLESLAIEFNSLQEKVDSKPEALTEVQ